MRILQPENYRILGPKIGKFRTSLSTVINRRCGTCQGERGEFSLLSSTQPKRTPAERLGSSSPMNASAFAVLEYKWERPHAGSPQQAKRRVVRPDFESCIHVGEVENVSWGEKK